MSRFIKTIYLLWSGTLIRSHHGYRLYLQISHRPVVTMVTVGFRGNKTGSRTLLFTGAITWHDLDMHVSSQLPWGENCPYLGNIKNQSRKLRASINVGLMPKYELTMKYVCPREQKNTNKIDKLASCFNIWENDTAKSGKHKWSLNMWLKYRRRRYGKHVLSHVRKIREYGNMSWLKQDWNLIQFTVKSKLVR